MNDYLINTEKVEKKILNETYYFKYIKASKKLELAGMAAELTEGLSPEEVECLGNLKDIDLKDIKDNPKLIKIFPKLLKFTFDVILMTLVEAPFKTVSGNKWSEASEEDKLDTLEFLDDEYLNEIPKYAMEFTRLDLKKKSKSGMSLKGGVRTRRRLS